MWYWYGTDGEGEGLDATAEIWGEKGERRDRHAGIFECLSCN